MKQFSDMTPEERRECGRQGGLKSGEVRRRKRAMKDTLSLLLSMPMKKGKAADIDAVTSFEALKGKNINVQEAMLVKMIQTFMKTGDPKLAEFIRDTVGDKPTDVVNIEGNIQTSNPYDELSVEELKALAKKCEEDGENH